MLLEMTLMTSLYESHHQALEELSQQTANHYAISKANTFINSSPGLSAYLLVRDARPLQGHVRNRFSYSSHKDVMTRSKEFVCKYDV